MKEIVVNLQFQILVNVTFKHTYVHWTNKSISVSQVLPLSRHKHRHSPRVATNDADTEVKQICHK